MDRDALVALAEALGIFLDTTSTVTQLLALMMKADYRAWLVEQGLVNASMAANMTDGAAMFFAAGAVAERHRAAQTRRHAAN